MLCFFLICEQTKYYLRSVNDRLAYVPQIFMPPPECNERGILFSSSPINFQLW